MFSKEFIWNCSIQFTQVLSVSSSFTFQPSAPPISTDSKADEEQLNNISTTEKESDEDGDSDYVDPTDAAHVLYDAAVLLCVSEHLSQDLALVFLLYFNIQARFEQFEVKF